MEEGYSLFDLVPVSIRNLFQDKVVRFHARTGKKLELHRFGAGDVVRLSVMEGATGAQPIAGMEAVILDRSAGFLDICIPSRALNRMDLQRSYRVDFSRSNSSYKRMTDGLQSLLKPKKDTSMGQLPNRLRDLLVLSYPNSITRLALSPGGLKLAMPLLYAPPARTTNDGTHAVVSTGTNVNGPSAATEIPLAFGAHVPPVDSLGSPQNASVSVLGAELQQTAKPPIPYPIFRTDARMRMLAKLIPGDHGVLPSKEVEDSGERDNSCGSV